jgi:hypothetical protein
MSTFVVGGITLPLIPSRCSESNTASLKTNDLPGTLPLIVSIGLKPRKITVEGYIYVAGQNKSYLNTNYIVPLRALVRTLVAVTSPDGIYNGNYVLEDFTPDQTSDYPSAFKYKMTLTQGDDAHGNVLVLG